MYKKLTIAVFFLCVMITLQAAYSSPEMIDQQEKPHIILHIEDPVLVSPLGHNVKNSQEDYTSIVELVRYIQKLQFPLTVVLRCGEEIPTLLKDTLQEFCGISPQHEGFLNIPFTLTITENKAITGVQNVLDFLKPVNHGIWKTRKNPDVKAQDFSYYPIPSEGNMLPFYLANQKSMIKVISPFEQFEPMSAYFFEKVGHIIRYNPDKLNDSRYLQNFFQHYMKINGYGFIPENNGERDTEDRTLEIDAGVYYSAHGAAEENRTLDPTLTKGVLYH